MNTKVITEEYLRDRFLKGVREGRNGLLSYRNISILTGTMPNAEGSAEVSLGDTKVVAGYSCRPRASIALKHFYKDVYLAAWEFLQEYNIAENFACYL